MKYKPEDYSISATGFYGLDDGEIECYQEKLVKCRKPHKCVGGCNKEIPKGAYAIRESGFMDGKPVSSYTCTDCLDKWMDELAANNSQYKFNTKEETQ
jgi:hypothetical protein